MSARQHSVIQNCSHIAIAPSLSPTRGTSNPFGFDRFQIDCLTWLDVDKALIRGIEIVRFDFNVARQSSSQVVMPITTCGEGQLVEHFDQLIFNMNDKTDNLSKTSKPSNS
ncbi:hypothetical protein [Pseudomonas viridiflava]|uniref:hypothetical protein n=1 Tax=Pseudomonas viridiflava TaxID=33069 RepID=UPI003FA0E405